MKKHFSAALCAATLTFGLTGAAHADIFAPTYVNLTFGSGLTQSGSVVQTEAADGSFDDFFLFFNAPSYSLDTYTGTAGAGVSFSSVTLFPILDPADAVALTGSLGAGGFNYSPTNVLPSAAWEMEITGTAALGSSYTLAISSTATDAPPLPTIPEPTNLALLMAGLGVVASKALRRKSKASA